MGTATTTVGGLNIEYELDGKPLNIQGTVTLTSEPVEVTSWGSPHREYIGRHSKTAEIQLVAGVIEGAVVAEKFIASTATGETRYELTIKPYRYELYPGGHPGVAEKAREQYMEVREALDEGKVFAIVTCPDASLHDKARERAIEQAPTPEIAAALTKLYELDEQARERGEVLVADVEMDGDGQPVFKTAVLDA